MSRRVLNIASQNMDTLKPINKNSSKLSQTNNNKNNNNNNKLGRKRKRSGVATAVKRIKKSKVDIMERIEKKIEQFAPAEALYCSGNISAIQKTLFELELKKNLVVTKSYFDFQQDIRLCFRKRLFDWIIQVHSKLKLRPDTLYLSVSLFDRFLCIKQIPRTELQKLGSCCLFISSKYHDIHCLSAQMLVNLADGAFDYEGLLECEEKVVHTLEFSLTVPTSLSFLQHFLLLKRNHSKYKRIELGSRYLCECLLFDATLIELSPSTHASIAFYWALKVLANEWWDEECELLCKKVETELQPYRSTILKLIKDKTSALYNKYATSKYSSISKAFCTKMALKKLEFQDFL